MRSRHTRNQQLSQSTPSLRTVFLVSTGVLAFFIALVYVIRSFWATLPEPKLCSGDCTLYASPTGNDGNSGTAPESAKTLEGAAAAARPGSVVCLLPGTYFLNSPIRPPANGTATAWIVYRNCGDGPANIAWTGPADASPMFKLGSGHFPSEAAYLEFRGLHLDGRGNAADGFFCRGGHHLRFIDNIIVNTGGAGIGSIDCDYLTIDHNSISHNGYMPSRTNVPQWYSWTSGISLNSNRWFDRHAGFHNIISNNVVTGQVDESKNHSDGNGIILDLSNGTYDYDSADTPPALIINNVVYGNGGRCIEAFTVSNFWIVNNTCYKNDLDRFMSAAGSITTSNGRDGYIINNISVAWQSTNPSYDQQNNNANIRYYRNLYYGSANNLKNYEPSEFIEADPLFANPPYFDARLERQYENTPAPSLAKTGFALEPASAAIGRGIDPTTLKNLPKPIAEDLKKYIYEDIAGNARPVGGPFDLGAYQSRTVR